jgi:hypothetical protein
MELGLKAMAAAGAHTVASLQQTPLALYANRTRDAAGNYNDAEQFQLFLRKVRDFGAVLHMHVSIEMTIH